MIRRKGAYYLGHEVGYELDLASVGAGHEFLIGIYKLCQTFWTKYGGKIQR